VDLKKLLAGIILTGILLEGCSSASMQRAQKDMQSEYGGGLNRVVTVYDNGGHVIRKYQGKIDIQEQTDSKGGSTGSDKVLFDLNGKRVILYNATVVVEEK
jgi:outer membrane lipoprotein-sorting protein